MEETNHPKSDSIRVITKAADKVAGFFTSLVPDALLFRYATAHASETDIKSQNLARQSRDLHSAVSITASTFADKEQESCHTRIVLKEDREEEIEDSPVWIFAGNLVSCLIYHHMWWSYALLFSTLLYPVSTFLAAVLSILSAVILFTAYDFVRSFLQGRNLVALAKGYYSFAVRRWRKFISGERRLGVLMAIGLAMDKNTQQKVIAQVEGYRNATDVNGIAHRAATANLTRRKNT